MKMRNLIALAGCVIVLADVAVAEDLHVPSQYPTIQAAIDAALPGDTVIVADGVYTGFGTRDITFGGKAITLKSANGPASTILDLQGTQENPHRGFDFDGETAATVLDGFTITNGSTPNGAILDEFNGAGILIRNGSPIIKNCIIKNNWAGCWGGAICCSWFGTSSPTIINCTIADNYCDDDGGAIFNLDNSPTIIDSIIVNNEARVVGGGITDFGGGAVTIINSTIAGNIAPTGAGIYGSTVNITNSIVWGNHGNEQVSGSATVTYSNVQGGFVGEGNLDVLPGFVDPANGDYHLVADSPLIDAADPSFVPDPQHVDLDGDPRLVAAAVDIGADEFRRPADVDADGTVGITDFLAVLGAWGACSGCLEDINDDGLVGIIDFLIILGDWG